MAAVIFDLDGTLVHSTPDILAAVNRMLAGEGAELLDIATITGFVGNGLPRLVERVIGARGLPMTDHARLTRVTLEFYTAAPADLTRPYPGVMKALGALTAAAQRGLSVPDDLSITGWDDLPEARRVGLTTVGQPLAGKGRTAGELLLAAGSTAPPPRVILPTSVEIRRTSGPPAPRR